MQTSKKQEIIKNIAIVFLAVLLVLTLFSNTILNASLPQVATQRVGGGSINARVRATGVVAAAESYQVTLDQTRTVRSVLVQVGQTVQEGDVLFLLEDGDSAELQAAEDTLWTLNNEYQKRQLNLRGEYGQEDRTIQRLQADLAGAIALRDANYVSDAALAAAQTALAAARGELADIDAVLADLYAQRDAATPTPEPSDEDADADTLEEQIRQYEDAQRQKTAEIGTLEAHLNDLQQKRAAYDAAQPAVAAAQRALEDATGSRDVDRKVDDLDLSAMRRQIARQEELVERLRAGTIDTAVCAGASGTVTALGVAPGRPAAANTALATIDVTDRGYTLRASVTREQARQLKAGAAAEVVNNFWNNDIQAVLERIVADPDAPNERQLLIFRVSGDVTPGTSLTLSVGQPSESYSALVPKSALRQDTNGYFALTVTSRSTPLGNRYTATRVNVQILAEDDANAAVSGLDMGAYVITTASAPLRAGEQVRLWEDPS